MIIPFSNSRSDVVWWCAEIRDIILHGPIHKRPIHDGLLPIFARESRESPSARWKLSEARFDEAASTADGDRLDAEALAAFRQIENLTVRLNALARSGNHKAAEYLARLALTTSALMNGVCEAREEMLEDVRGVASRQGAFPVMLGPHEAGSGAAYIRRMLDRYQIAAAAPETHSGFEITDKFGNTSVAQDWAVRLHVAFSTIASGDLGGRDADYPKWMRDAVGVGVFARPVTSPAVAKRFAIMWDGLLWAVLGEPETHVPEFKEWADAGRNKYKDRNEVEAGKKGIRDALSRAWKQRFLPTESRGKKQD